jgi:hypothetical protein
VKEEAGGTEEEEEDIEEYIEGNSVSGGRTDEKRYEGDDDDVDRAGDGNEVSLSQVVWFVVWDLSKVEMSRYFLVDLGLSLASLSRSRKSTLNIVNSNPTTIQTFQVGSESFVSVGSA